MLKADICMLILKTPVFFRSLKRILHKISTLAAVFFFIFLMDGCLWNVGS